MKIPNSISIVLGEVGRIRNVSVLDQHIANFSDPEQVITLEMTDAMRDLFFNPCRAEVMARNLGEKLEYRHLLQIYSGSKSWILLLFDQKLFLSFLTRDCWLDRLQSSSTRLYHIFLVGWKNGLDEMDPRQEVLSEGMTWDNIRAKKLQDFTRISAISGMNVDACFKRFVKVTNTHILMQEGPNLE